MNVPSQFPFALPFLMRGKVRVKNASGESVPHGAVMRVTTTTVVGNCIVATIDKPNGTLQRSYLVNCGPKINAVTGSRGWGTRLFEDGLVLCTGTPTIGSECGPASGSWTLVQDYPGFLITGATQAVGSNTCVVATQIANISFFGKVVSAVAKGDTNGVVAIWSRNFGGATGQTISGCANYTSALLAGDKVTGSFLSGGPVIAKLVCD